jgi:DNA-binding PucR family transcriptional regulator
VRLTDGSPPRAEDHLADLVLAADEPLLRALAQRRLAPLHSLPPRTRGRLAETLLAWLEQGRSAPAAARVLHAHPQTVRYRLGQLRELLGDALDDAGTRFELELALRGERLAGSGAGDRR